MCKVGTGGQQQPNFAQQKPNDCSKDKNICGTTGEELCATTTKGECSEQSYRPCTPGSTVCEDNDAGTCIISPRPCFEPRITRSGSPSPLGTYCAYEVKTCSSNADCSGEGDYCVADSSRPESVALFCVPATAQTSINNVGGITGPGAIRFSGQVKVCRCGDSVIGCDETCDDGNTVGGDGCDEFCQQE
jgi:cysteine-rich repeat protein